MVISSDLSHEQGILTHRTLLTGLIDFFAPFSVNSRHSFRDTQSTLCHQQSFHGQSHFDHIYIPILMFGPYNNLTPWPRRHAFTHSASDTIGREDICMNKLPNKVLTECRLGTIHPAVQWLWIGPRSWRTALRCVRRPWPPRITIWFILQFRGPPNLPKDYQGSEGCCHSYREYLSVQ